MHSHTSGVQARYLPELLVHIYWLPVSNITFILYGFTAMEVDDDLIIINSQEIS